MGSSARSSTWAWLRRFACCSSLMRGKRARGIARGRTMPDWRKPNAFCRVRSSQHHALVLLFLFSMPPGERARPPSRTAQPSASSRRRWAELREHLLFGVGADLVLLLVGLADAGRRTYAPVPLAWHLANAARRLVRRARALRRPAPASGRHAPATGGSCPRPDRRKGACVDAGQD